ncbi:hypothetical protein [Bordetella bronchialis]|uniref:Uncharacterized protein n=1 Tax=Bordetella bronchialis TaxID=463025 RepID=A0A193FTE4_9BORD|nr:hypothetical protein [Bordetella bronchialis]ANN70910.1 hypothetical protein BAU08_05810 [Bordetella bronchialis]
MSAPSNPPVRAPAPRLVKATVARGHTVLDMDGKRCIAGAEIELPAADVKRLRSIGYLVDPEKPPVRLDIGPSFGSYGGPQIRRG